jgi:hypothetical protein
MAMAMAAAKATGLAKDSLAKTIDFRTTRPRQDQLSYRRPAPRSRHQPPTAAPSASPGKGPRDFKELLALSFKAAGTNVRIAGLSPDDSAFQLLISPTALRT